MTITLRSVKGSALTFTELDGNFIDLNGRTTALEGASTTNPIDAITITGNTLTFHYSTAFGGGSDSVVIPPSVANGRGDWQPATSYAVNDLVVVNHNSLYIVDIAHLSDATFDPGKQIGGFDVYDFIIGNLGQTTSGALTGSTYTLQGDDNLKYYRCTNAGGCAVTIPDSGSVNVALDAEVTFRQSAAGAVTFAAAGGVTMNVPSPFTAATNYLGAVVTLKKIGTDEWDVFGALAG
jgi:hypothetical protein